MEENFVIVQVFGKKLAEFYIAKVDWWMMTATMRVFF